MFVESLKLGTVCNWDLGDLAVFPSANLFQTIFVRFRGFHWVINYLVPRRQRDQRFLSDSIGLARASKKNCVRNLEGEKMSFEAHFIRFFDIQEICESLVILVHKSKKLNLSFLLIF